MSSIDPKLPQYSELVQALYEEERNPLPEYTFDTQFDTRTQQEILKDQLTTDELQQVFDQVQEQEKKDFRNLTIKEFLNKLLSTLFYVLIDIFENNENVITAMTKDDRPLFIGLNILILLIFIKTFIL